LQAFLLLSALPSSTLEVSASLWADDEFDPSPAPQPTSSTAPTIPSNPIANA